MLKTQRNYSNKCGLGFNKKMTKGERKREGKKKTRRGGRARHPMLIQYAKMMSKNQEEKRDLAHIKCYACEELGHLASGCPRKLEKKAQANKENQGNEKQHMNKEEKAQSKRVCY
jgi:hypothetical protein